MEDDSFISFALFDIVSAATIAAFGITVFNVCVDLLGTVSGATTGAVTIGNFGAYNLAFLSVISVYMQADEIESSPPLEKQSIF